MKKKLTLVIVITSHILMIKAQSIYYETANDHEWEHKIINKLKELNKKYDLKRFVYTDSIIIDKNAIPHSHPKLTIHTRHLHEEDRLLSTFLHENFHWYEEEYPDRVAAAIEQLKKKFPEVPVGRPKGAKDEYSSYLHLLVCYWEHRALEEIIGTKKALEVTKSWNHYQWIYETILKESEYLDKLLIDYDLNELNTVKGVLPEKLKETSKFIFYNHYWTNQHFFFHRVASLNRKKSLEEVLGKKEWKKLGDNEQKQIDDVIKYYKENIIEQHLFSSNMVGFRIWITSYTKDQNLPITVYDKVWIEKLNNIKSLYEKYFWKKHSKTNINKLNKYFDSVNDLEASVISKLSKLAHQEWQKNKVRIDLAYYANWAGAYTLARVPSKIIIATVRPREEIKYDFVETVFHESSHSIVSSKRGAISQTIKEVSKELNIEVPERLWHAVLFYMAGKVTQDALFEKGIKDYTQYAYRHKLYVYYDQLEKFLDPYIAGKQDLKGAMINLVKAFKEG